MQWVTWSLCRNTLHFAISFIHSCTRNCIQNLACRNGWEKMLVDAYDMKTICLLLEKQHGHNTYPQAWVLFRDPPALEGFCIAVSATCKTPLQHLLLHLFQFSGIPKNLSRLQSKPCPTSQDKKCSLICIPVINIVKTLDRNWNHCWIHGAYLVRSRTSYQEKSLNIHVLCQICAIILLSVCKHSDFCASLVQNCGCPSSCFSAHTDSSWGKSTGDEGFVVYFIPCHVHIWWLFTMNRFAWSWYELHGRTLQNSPGFYMQSRTNLVFVYFLLWDAFLYAVQPQRQPKLSTMFGALIWLSQTGLKSCLMKYCNVVRIQSIGGL